MYQYAFDMMNDPELRSGFFQSLTPDQDIVVKIIEDAEWNEKDISYDEFIKKVSISDLRELFPNYDWSPRPKGLTFKKDWHIKYHECTLAGEPCVYVVWSGYQFFFTPSGRDWREMIQQYRRDHNMDDDEMDETRKRIGTVLGEAFVSTLGQEVERHKQTVSGFVEELKNAIRELPDNPRIQRLSKQAFVLKYSDLEDNWSPQYYDFKAQYQEIINQIEGLTLEQMDRRIKTILKDGQIMKKSGISSYTYKFHPDVMDHLYKLYFGDNEFVPKETVKDWRKIEVTKEKKKKDDERKMKESDEPKKFGKTEPYGHWGEIK